MVCPKEPGYFWITFEGFAHVAKCDGSSQRLSKTAICRLFRGRRPVWCVPCALKPTPMMKKHSTFALFFGRDHVLGPGAFCSTFMGFMFILIKRHHPPKCRQKQKHQGQVLTPPPPGGVCACCLLLHALSSPRGCAAICRGWAVTPCRGSVVICCGVYPVTCRGRVVIPRRGHSHLQGMWFPLQMMHFQPLQGTH